MTQTTITETPTLVTAVLLLSLLVGVAAATVEIGRGVDLLQQFGITGDVLFGHLPSTKEPLTHDIVNGTEHLTEVLNITKNTSSINITFCPDLECLFSVYFDDFRVDLSDKPWKLLTTNRFRHLVSERFGVPDIAMGFGQKFVIVTFRRPVKRIRAFENFTQLAELKSTMIEKLKCMSIGIESMVTDFISDYGSHYINEYTVGDVLYQVLVYLPDFYKKFHTKCVLNKCTEAETVLFLSPIYTEYQGQVMSIGSDETVEKWVDSNLQTESKLGWYTSLYTLKKKPDLKNEVTAIMNNQTVVGLHLKVISSLFNDTVKKKWFTEVLDNHVKLREVNL